jgi:hypothetical protein
MEGGAEVDKLAASVREVSGASALASDGLSSLEASITALTAVVAENTAALAGMETSLGGVGRSAATATVSTKALTNEMKMLEGAMPIKAAASFLANLGGIGTAMQMAFPIFGAVALVGYLGTLIEKTGLLPKMWDDVAEAQKSSQELLEKSTKEYDRHLEKLKQIRLEQYELAHGKDARRALEASELQFKAATVDQQDIDRLQKQVDALKFFSTPTAKTATQEQRFYAGLAGLSSAADDNLAQAQLPFGLNGESFGSRQEAAKKLLPSFEWALRAASVQKADDQGSSDLENSKIAADQKKKAEEDAAKRKRELAEAEKQAASYLREAQNFELTGLERINEIYAEKLALLGKTKKAIDDINAAHAIEVQRELQRVAVQGVNDSRVASDAQYSDKQIVARATMESTRRLAGAGNTSSDAAHSARMAEIAEERKATADRLAADIADAEQIASIQGNRKEADKLIAAARRKADHDNAEQQAEEIKANTDKQLADIAEVKRANEEAYKIAATGDAANANKVQRQLEGLVRQNQLAVHGGSMTGASAAESDYNARIAAAQRVLDIETSHLSLLKDEKKEAEKLAEFQAKADEARYRAGVEFETALQALREQDLKKYEQMAGSLFDALHSHSMNQWLKNFALGQEKQIFTNLATPVLQNAGHALGGIIPNVGPLGTLLHGTIFDNANADPAKDTAQHTKDTVDQVKGLRSDLKGIFTNTNNPDTVVTPGGAGSIGAGVGAAGLSDVFNLPMASHSAVSSLMSVIPGMAGSASAFSQFMGGASTSPSMAFAQLLGIEPPNGTVGYNPETGTPDDQYGNPITTSTATQIGQGAAVGGALAAGAASIYSGISQGGTKGDLQAVSGGLNVASMVPGPQQPFVAAAASLTQMASMFFGTGPQQRNKDIANYLAQDQYLAPTALNVMQGMNGTYEDLDARGNLRTSTMSAVPTVAEPYITKRTINGNQNWYDAPGGVQAPYSGGASGNGVAPVAGGVTINVNAIDTQTGIDFILKNHSAVGESLATHLQRHDGRASNEIRKITQS